MLLSIIKADKKKLHTVKLSDHFKKPFLPEKGRKKKAQLTIHHCQEVSCAEHRGCPQQRHWGACGRQRPEYQCGR